MDRWMAPTILSIAIAAIGLTILLPLLVSARGQRGRDSCIATRTSQADGTCKLLLQASGAILLNPKAAIAAFNDENNLDWRRGPQGEWYIVVVDMKTRILLTGQNAKKQIDVDILTITNKAGDYFGKTLYTKLLEAKNTGKTVSVTFSGPRPGRPNTLDFEKHVVAMVVTVDGVEYGLSTGYYGRQTFPKS